MQISRYTLAVLLTIHPVWSTHVLAQCNTIQSESYHRLCVPGLQQTLWEGLAYLEDNQIRNRPGRGSSLRDSSEEGDGCRGRVSLNLPCREDVGIPQCETHNKSGEWASHIHLLPNRLGWNGRTVVGPQDSSLFVTTAVAHGLLLFDDSRLPPQRQFVSAMLLRSLDNIAKYKRGEAYNFWRMLPGSDSPIPRSGPPNISLPYVIHLAKRHARHPNRVFYLLLLHGQHMLPRSWSIAVLDRCQNPTGADAFFNVPNDEDEISMAVALQWALSQRFPQLCIHPDFVALSRPVTYCTFS